MKKFTILFLAIFVGLITRSSAQKDTPTESPTAEVSATATGTETTGTQSVPSEKRQIPHTGIDIRYPAIIEVNGDVYADRLYEVACANWNDEDSILITVRDSILNARGYYGVDHMVFDNKQDANQTTTNYDTAIQTGINHYLSFNQDESINAIVVDKLEKAGVPMVSMQIKARNGVDPEYHIDNYKFGILYGELLIKEAGERWLDEKSVLFMAGHLESGVNFIQRAEGCRDSILGVLLKTKAFEINTEGGPEITRQGTVDFLIVHSSGEIMVWCHIDQNTMDVLTTIRTAGRVNDVIVISCDTNLAAFEGLKKDDSPILGAIAQFSERFGWDLLPMVIKHLDDGTKSPLETAPPPSITTKENLYTCYPDVQ